MLKNTLSPNHHFPSLTKGKSIYAIGDIHGRLDCLREMLRLLENQRRHEPADCITIIFLGDYIDRGKDSRAVIETLLKLSLPGNTVFLLGNHEKAMLDFIKGSMPYDVWLHWGGGSTLASYGMKLLAPDAPEKKIRTLRYKFLHAVPPAHLDFLQRLKLYHIEEHYLFVHAGLRPGIPLEKQKEKDLLMIREDFLEHDVSEDKVIIHGHTIFEIPHIREKSIGIDTGAYATGKLTALILEENRQEFISTSCPTS